MQIAGLVKNSFVDYPGHIAAAVFVPGCNMDCWYCHNRALWQRGELLDEAGVMDFLKRRAGFLDGVVVCRAGSLRSSPIWGTSSAARVAWATA